MGVSIGGATASISRSSESLLRIGPWSTSDSEEPVWIGWAKDAMAAGRLSLECAPNVNTFESVCSRSWDTAWESVVDAIVLSNWRRESMKRQTMIEVIL